MPRYYLQVADGRYDRDFTGSIFSNNTEAQRQAIIFAGEFIHGNPTYLLHDVDLRIYVMDQSNMLLFSVTIFAPGAPYRNCSGAEQNNTDYPAISLIAEPTIADFRRKRASSADVALTKLND